MTQLLQIAQVMMPKDKKPKDTGIIPELGITEEMRDSLAKRDWSKPDPKNDPSLLPANWTTTECERKKFSGIRVNKLNGMTEIWAVGKILKEAQTEWVSKDPARLASMLEEAFQTNGSILEIDVPVKHIPTTAFDKRKH